MSHTPVFVPPPDPFKPEPPEKPAVLKALFCGRTRALRQGTETLRSYWDYDGCREDSDKRPWIIHGESRAGKSHLARCILVDLSEHAPEIVTLVIPARKRDSAQMVLETLFEKLRNEFFTRIHGPNVPGAVLLDPMVQNAILLIDRLKSFGHEGTPSITIANSKGWKTGLDLSGAHGLWAIVKLVLRWTVESSGNATETVTLSRPGVSDLANYCCVMVDTLWRVKLVTEVVILFDDVDLLSDYQSAEINGQRQRCLLSDALAILHKTPCVDVLVTSRSWYAMAHKEFEELVDLNQEAHDLSEGDLIAIHHQRHKVLMPTAPCEFLNEKALLELAHDVKCIPGVFLQHLSQAYKEHKTEGQWTQHDYDWFIKRMCATFERNRKQYQSAAAEILSAVHAGRFELSVSDQNFFLNTPFEDEFVYQSYHGEKSYSISGLMAKIVPRLAAPSVVPTAP